MLLLKHHSHLQRIGSDPICTKIIQLQRNLERHTSTFRAKPRFGAVRKFNNSKLHSFKRGGGSSSKRFLAVSESIFLRFIKKGVQVKEKPYVCKHTFADFPFNPQL